MEDIIILVDENGEEQEFELKWSGCRVQSF
jgi:hypothetical protein